MKHIKETIKHLAHMWLVLNKPSLSIIIYLVYSSDLLIIPDPDIL